MKKFLIKLTNGSLKYVVCDNFQFIENSQWVRFFNIENQPKTVNDVLDYKIKLELQSLEITKAVFNCSHVESIEVYEYND